MYRDDYDGYETGDDYSDGNYEDVTDSIDFESDEKEKKETISRESVDHLSAYSGIDLSKIDYVDLDKVENTNQFTDEDMKIFKYLVRSGNKDSIQFVGVKFIEALEGLIYSLIQLYAGDLILKNKQNTEDCVQECRETIIKLLPNYDFQFAPATYFHPRLIETITRYTRDYVNAPVIKQSKTHMDRMIKVKKAISRLEAEGKEPTVANLTVATGMTFKCVEEALDNIAQGTPVPYDSDAINATVASNTPTPEQAVIQQEQSSTLINMVNTVSVVQRNIFLEYYGISYENGALVEITPKSVRTLSKKYKKSENEITTLINMTRMLFLKNKEFRKYYGEKEKKKKKESNLRLKPNAVADALLYDDFD